MSSSIDDEFASLFLPDLELLNSMNNGNNKSEEQQQMDEMPNLFLSNQIPHIPEARHQDPASIHMDDNSGSHWLHHYGKLAKSYPYEMNQLQQQPFMGFPGQMQMPQAPSPSIFAEPTSINVFNALETQHNTPRPLESMDFAANRATPGIGSMNMLYPPTPINNDAMTTIKETLAYSASPVPESSEKPSKKKKKEESSEHADLLLMHPQALPNMTTLFDHQANAVQCKLSGEIDGRFLYSEGDLLDSTTMKISCYRRNYIKIMFKLLFETVPETVTNRQDRLPITAFKIKVFGTTSKSEEPMDLIIEESKKKSGSPGVVYMEKPDFHLPVDSIAANTSNRFVLKKTQFKTATPNTSRSSGVQNVFYIDILVSAVTLDSNEVPVLLLKSTPIKVRGRNPSFYNNRDDILIVKSVSKQDDMSESDEIVSKQPSVEMVNSENLKTNVAVPVPSEVKATFTSGTTKRLDVTERPTSATQQEPESPTSYEYFPLSNVYYLPPLDAHYFPHAIHHPRQSSIARHRRRSEGLEDHKAVANDIWNSPDSNISNSRTDNSENARLMKMRMMNILNYDSNSSPAGRPQGRFFDAASSGITRS